MAISGAPPAGAWILAGVCASPVPDKQRAVRYAVTNNAGYLDPFMTIS
jgi:hypothetical protein